jgi:hypothetical protein
MASHLRRCSPVAPFVVGKIDMATMNKYKGSRRKEAFDIVFVEMVVNGEDSLILLSVFKSLFICFYHFIEEAYFEEWEWVSNLFIKYLSFLTWDNFTKMSLVLIYSNKDFALK